MVRLTQAQLNDVLAGRYEIIPDAKKSVSGMIEAAGLEENVKCALLDWCRIRHHDVRYTAIAVQSLIDIARKNTTLYGASAVCEIIRECIGNGYKGIAWDKLKRYQQIGFEYADVDMEYLRNVYEKVKGDNKNEST